MQRRKRYVLTIFFVTSTFVWTTEADSGQSQNYDDQPIELPPRPRRRKHKDKEELPPIPSEVGGTDEPALSFEAGFWTDNSDGDWEPDLNPKSKALGKCEKRGEIYFPATEMRVPLFRPARTKLGYVMCRYSKAAIRFITLQGLKGQNLLYWQYVNYFSTQTGNKYLEKCGFSMRVELPDEKSEDLSKMTAGRTGSFKRDNWEPRKSSKSLGYHKRASSTASVISGLSQLSRVSQITSPSPRKPKSTSVKSNTKPLFVCFTAEELDYILQVGTPIPRSPTKAPISIGELRAQMSFLKMS